MALPKQNAVTYSLIVPSTGKEVKFRPFLVKDEKELMIAQQSEDVKVMIDSLKNIIKSCVQDEIDINNLATFDIEYIFTKIRAKSVGEFAEIYLKCDACTDDKAIALVKVNLNEVEVLVPEGHSNNIKLFDDVGITMKYPSFDMVKDLQALETDNVNQLFDIVVGCIDTIYNSNEVFHAKEQTKEEMIDFLNNLSSEQFSKIQSFFENMPKLTEEVEYACPVCNMQHKKLIEGIQSFF